MEHEVREAHPTLAAGGTGVVHQPALQHLAREGIAVAPPAILERYVGWVASSWIVYHVLGAILFLCDAVLLDLLQEGGQALAHLWEETLLPLWMI